LITPTSGFTSRRTRLGWSADERGWRAHLTVEDDEFGVPRRRL
jgi:hypothetical protein